MKVLAIRGRNLASLAADFEVDFRAEPLASAGLYAITGPTGSGKSTLLDALCLALYGGTPRLAGAGRGNVPDVADETLSAGDARALLRRGAGEGFAEVDFCGADGVDYRARWSARRARSKASGRHQLAEMSLTRIADGLDIGGRNVTDVRREIETRVGLRFEQFTRAVLLAQNEFAAFLKSDETERAELLEMLTGTGRFSMLSIRAHQRARDEGEVLARLHARLEGQLPLDNAARTQLEADLAQAGADLTRAQGRCGELESHLRWHQALEQAMADERTAQARSDAAALARESAGPRRDTLRRIESVQPARALLETRRRTAREADEAALASNAAQHALATATADATRVNDTLALAVKALADAQESHRAMAPTIERARALAAQLDSLGRVRDGEEKALASATNDAIEARNALAARQTELARAQADITRLSVWIQAHGSLRELAGQWPRWDNALSQAASQAGALTEDDRALPGLTRVAEQAQQALERAATSQAALDAAARCAQEALSSAAAKLSAFDAEALARQRTLLENRRDALAGAASAWNDVIEAARAHSVLGEKLDARRAEHAEALRRHASAALARPGAQARSDQAERSLRRAETAAADSVEQLRAGLEPDAACPVCGALDHPYATHEPGLRAALEALRAEATQARQALEAIERESAAAESAAATQRQSAEELAREQAGQAGAVERARQHWAAHPVAAEAPQNDAARQPWLVRQNDAVRATFAELATREQAARQALMQRDNAQSALNTAGEALAKAVAATHLCAQTAQASTQALSTATQHRAASRERLSTLLVELDGAFPDARWRDPWQTDPAAFQDSVRAQASHWNEQSRQLELLAPSLENLAGETRSLATRRDDRNSVESAARQQLDARNAGILALSESLRELLGGRTAEAVEQGLVERVTVARQAHEQRQTQASEARVSEAKAQASVTQSAGIAARTAIASAHAAAALDSWLHEFATAHPDTVHLGTAHPDTAHPDTAHPDTAHPDTAQTDPASLESLLSHEPDWIIGERKALGDLEVSAREAAAVFGDRRAARERHESSRPAPDASDALREQLAAALVAKTAASDHAAALQGQRVQDDGRRASTTQTGSLIVAQEAIARTWSQLNDLIGSSDGRKFRNVAQQTTLDVLLGYANHHLASLARRYRLDRIPDTLGLMVVDQDMGDERRSVLSLSGGESFLVSLGLALGLASLSSQRIKVESLFIDEGFGSLDADALRVALEALDGLQAQGRKVGVISHVPEMTDRIGTQIRVERVTQGRSRVVVAG